jgi:phage terminase small subunit
MARNRTPTAILEAKGSYIINPERKRDAEPKGGGPLGGPPKYLMDEEKKIWKEIAKRLPNGVAFESDRDSFEMLVRLTHVMRYSGKTLTLADESEFTVPDMKSAERATLISLWSRFAMTPSDRSKVSVDKEPDDEFQSFMARKKAPVQ